MTLPHLDASLEFISNHYGLCGLSCYMISVVSLCDC